MKSQKSISEIPPPQLVCGHRLEFILDPCFSGLSTPCCDLCVLKKSAELPESLTADESHVLALRDQIMTRKGPTDQTSQETGDRLGNEINVDALQLPARNITGEGPHCGNRLKAYRTALRAWRIEVWTRDFRRSRLIPEVILPDKMLSKLAMQARLKTRDLIKEALPGWALADRYREDALKVLEPIDKGWVKEAEQKKEENRAKWAKQSAKNKARHEENARVAWRQASDEKKAAEQAFASQPLQLPSIVPMPHPFQPYTWDAVSQALTYPSHYPYLHYNIQIHPYCAYSQTMLNQGVSSSQSPSYIPGYPYPHYMHPGPSGLFMHMSSS